MSYSFKFLPLAIAGLDHHTQLFQACFDNNTIYVDRVLYSKSDYIKKLNLVNIL